MFKRALVANCSAPAYNLGAEKCANYLARIGYDVVRSAGDPGVLTGEFDVVALSVIFSWHAPIAREIALRVRDHAEVWCGGPGMFALRKWWREETGLDAVSGLDDRFEREPGSYRMVFASRGCPVGCSFCIVPRLEGTSFTLNWDFQPATILCDNNLSALPIDFQEHIIGRYRSTGVKLGDANSGFEPATFDAETYARWKPVLRGPWRFAFDETSEEKAVRTMMQVLANESARRKRVYVLAGNEPIEDCIARAYSVIDWGGEPYAQYVRPLNWLGDPAALRHRFDWSEQLGSDFKRYFDRPEIFRSCEIWEYRPRKNEPPPFARFAPKARSVVIATAPREEAQAELDLGQRVPVCVHGWPPGECDEECSELGELGFHYLVPGEDVRSGKEGCLHVYIPAGRDPETGDRLERCVECDESRRETTRDRKLVLTYPMT